MRVATFATLLAGVGLFVISGSNARATTITLTQTLTNGGGMPSDGLPAGTDLFTWTITWSGVGTPTEVAHLQVGPPGLPGSTHMDLSGADAIDRLADFIQDLHTPPDPPAAMGAPFVPTPEPATAVLLGAGLALVGLALAQRRRRG